MVEGGIGGSDESFISFSFAIVSVIVTIVYIPWVIKHARSIVEYFLSPNKRQKTMTNPLSEMWSSITYVPSVAMMIMAEPSMVPVGARFCFRERQFFLSSLLPRFLRFVIRPKILILWLWFVLFSSAMYVTLTFDAHAILGVPTSASTGEVKKAYRMLSRRYHPDHNNTEEARRIYVQVRRAYKALVDREAFEEEEAKNAQEFSVGVALPRFLTSREHDGLVLFGLLSLLVAVPVAIWYNFRDVGGTSHYLRSVQRSRERLGNFLKFLGIPEDQKYVERRESRRYLVRLLVSLGLMPRNTDEDTPLNLPPYADFITRCVEIDKNITFLKDFFEEKDIEMLHEYLVKNGVRLLDEFEAARAVAEQDENNCHLASLTEYKVVLYFLSLHIEETNQALEVLLEKMGTGVPSARKLMNLHKEVVELLHLVFEGDNKQVKGHIQKLMTIPQRASDVVNAIEPEMEAVYKKMYRNYLQAHVGSKNEKRLLKANLRRS